jgi:nicotinamidase-related amidase/alkylated DNA repair dioxygenase AlkB
MTLLLVDFQEEFFSDKGILGAKFISRHVAAVAARLIASWPRDSVIVCVTSCYDRWKAERPNARFVDAIAENMSNKSDRLARAHSGGRACCERANTALFALVPEVSDALKLRASNDGNVVYVEKEFYSAFIDTRLEEILRARQSREIVIAGQTTSSCVQATAIDAYRLGFDVRVCTDASAASTVEKHCENVAAVARVGVWRPVTSGELLRGSVPNVHSFADGFRSVPDVLPPELARDAFERVRAELPWAPMFHKGIAVSRLVATQGEVNADGSAPIYRFPTDEQFRPDPWSPTMLAIRDALQAALAQSLNHAKAQLYEQRSAHIGAHSDKTLDIEHDSWIVNLSLGATRVMRVESKQDRSVVELIEMRHNSAVLFNTRANQLWLHSVPACAKRAAELSDDDRLHDGARISIVFRAIGTHLTADNRLVGQGAKPGGLPVDAGRDETLALLAAFRDENRQGMEFDWAAAYGGGSNVVRLDPAVLQ